MKIDRKIIHAKYEGHCAYCGKVIAFNEMQVDHVYPKALRSYVLRGCKSGDIKKTTHIPEHFDDFSNLMPSCRRCNHYKRAHLLESFRALMMSLHTRIANHYINKVGIDYGIIEIKPWNGIFFFESQENIKVNPLK
jgi:5-methylcytosine-specific restriction endonuclease McrA